MMDSNDGDMNEMGPGKPGYLSFLAFKARTDGDPLWERLFEKEKKRYMNTNEDFKNAFEGDSHWKKLTDEIKAKREEAKKENITAGVLGLLIVLIFGIPFVAAVLIYNLWAGGYVLTHLWEWFVMPIVDKPLSMSQAIGIVLIMSFLTHQPERLHSWYKSQQEEVPFGQKALYAGCLFLGPWTTLLFGWGIHKIMM